MPLPKVYAWNIEEVCKWLREISYKQYQNTFRANLINGQNLLLMDASALAAMNIKNFVHIKEITSSIRSLFYFEMTKFGRCITLYPEFRCELYKLFRLKTGAKYEVRRSDLWRKMQLIREKGPNFLHWEILERWLNFDQGPKCIERFGDVHRSNACTAALPKSLAVGKSIGNGQFCEFNASELIRCKPWRFKCLPPFSPDTEFVEYCEKCIPPCSCRWPFKKYQTHGVLSYLKEELPNKYGGMLTYVSQSTIKCIGIR